MRDPTLLNAALIGLLAGFAAYVLSCTVHVWRKRNRGASGADGAPVAVRRLARYCLVAFALGLAMIALAAGWREMAPREGYLTGEGLLTVRVPDDLEVASVTKADFVQAGGVLARFSCPQRESKIRVLELRQAALTAEKDILADEPLTLDPELVRRYQSITADKRQTRASLDQLAPALDLVLREGLSQRLARRERLCVLPGELERAQSQLAQVAAKLSHSRNSLERAQHAAKRGAVTPNELENRQTQTQVLAAEAKKLQAEHDSLRQEQEQLERGLREYGAVATGQTEEMSEEVSQRQREMTDARSRAKALLALLEADAARARRLRRRKIEQLDVEIAQAEAELAGVRRSLVVTAPFPGRVVYRERSPRTAGRDSPLAVLAREDALRLRLRLSAAEADALAKESDVRLELTEPDVERRFTGALLRRDALAAEPGYVAAEVACHPPRRTVRGLAGDTVVRARLAWRPPLTVYPWFWAGAILAAVGASGRVVLGRWARKAEARVRLEAPRPSVRRPVAGRAAAPASLEGAAAQCSARLLRVLGQQLAVMVAEGRREAGLLDAVEWVLDRAATQAIVEIREGLNGDPYVHERIRQVQQRLDSQAAASGPETPHDTFDRRLGHVLRVVALDVLCEEPDRAGACVS